ncbi:androgen-dependent TFPI-regulating protein-like [Manduca sexta]|uniref:androgen-dependent TFPI-regulating protein-like n=1 Tax=Manduca sexta TaxID=7130 RepID=UPI00189093AA|nr:androgen-dependent TFPI-regulating protein-like [Manduca sexta]
MEKVQSLRTISTTTKLRIAGYVVTIVVHTVNGLIMESGFYGGAMSDPGVRRYYEFRTRFITCWTFVAQIIYAALELYCEVKNIQGKKDSNIIKKIKQYNDITFPGIVVPYSFMVPTMFWTLFIYDKNLILPAFMKKVVSSFSNHLVHTAVVPVVVWEMAFNPRYTRRSHAKNLMTLAFSPIALILGSQHIAAVDRNPRLLSFNRAFVLFVQPRAEPFDPFDMGNDVS